jgi:hypothetical protein
MASSSRIGRRGGHLGLGCHLSGYSHPTLTGAGLRRAAVVGILRPGWVSRRRFPRRASRRSRSPGAGVDLAEQQPRAGGRWGRLCQDSPVEGMVIPV